MWQERGESRWTGEILGMERERKRKKERDRVQRWRNRGKIHKKRQKGKRQK